MPHDVAVKVAERMRRRGKKIVAPYRCPVCHEWHVGADVAGVRGKKKRG